MNGADLRNVFLEERPGTPFLFMSGHAQDALGHDAQKLSGVLLRKPFTPNGAAVADQRGAASSGVKNRRKSAVIAVHASVR